MLPSSHRIMLVISRIIRQKKSFKICPFFASPIGRSHRSWSMLKRKRNDENEKDFPYQTRSRSLLPKSYKEEQDYLCTKFLDGGLVELPRLNIVEIPEKGEGLVAHDAIPKHTFLCEYRGELLSREEGLQRENLHFKRTGENRYCFFFFLGDVRMCIDPHEDSIALKMNHSSKNPNVIVRVMLDSESIPHLCFFANRAIRAQEELLFDYGDRRKKVLERCEWLRE